MTAATTLGLTVHRFYRLPFGYRVHAQKLHRRTRLFIDVEIGFGRRLISAKRV